MYRYTSINLYTLSLMKKQQGRRCNETEARKTSKPEMQSTVTNSKMDVIDLPSLYKKKCEAISKPTL